MSRVSSMDIDKALEELLLTRPVTSDDVAGAYRRMASRFHPDQVADPEEKQWAQRKFLQVQEAYELLKKLPVEDINALRRRGASWESREVGDRPWERPAGIARVAPPYSGLSSSPRRKIAVAFLMPMFFLFLLPALVMASWDHIRHVWSGGRPAPVVAVPREVQSFGPLRAIGFGQDGRNFAEFERLSTPVHTGDVIYGFQIEVLNGEVRFQKDGKSWTCTPSLSQ
ncbi:MAG: DnaJ domain-containing protein [Planctomycetes bacterium]|jgi:hypothetical protein|nr:DnaJ domain-containing protein [Planctomycetota bacterium]